MAEAGFGGGDAVEADGDLLWTVMDPSLLRCSKIALQQRSGSWTY
jgi:hypothetical protein